MALTPDDVVTKQFQHVRFKEGFDPDEVDDFLDEIVVEWRKTIAENDELKAKLAAYESGEQPAAPVAAAPDTAAAPLTGVVTRARTGTLCPSTRYPSDEYACATSTSTSSPLPTSARAALRDPNWLAAMREEFDDL